MGSYTPFSSLALTRSSFERLAQQDHLSPGLACPEFQEHTHNVSFDAIEDQIYFPCPLPQTETISILKAIEGCWAACIADLRYGKQARAIKIQLERSARYLLGSYLFSIDGLTKLDPDVKSRVKNTDLNQAQSILYRRFSSNLYATKYPDEYFHLHGSLDSSTALRMIGMEPFRPDLTEYDQCISAIEDQMKRFTIDELEEINAKHRQAGVTANKREDFVKSEYGHSVLSTPKWTVTPLDAKPGSPPPVPFFESSNRKPLSGLKVLELTRVIAGPSITRILVEYGASVLKVTSPHLPDVPFFQVEGNMGKHTTALDLKDLEDRNMFETLLADADIVVDGYRTGAIERLGYGVETLTRLGKERGRGFVYVQENCFGYENKPEGYVGRPGWQQIADCVSGVAWEQGRWMCGEEPVVPPFPMSDYGTGLMGAVATLEAVWRRAKEGGSWRARCALVQYDNLLFEVGLYEESVRKELKKKFEEDDVKERGFLKFRHADSTDAVSGKALEVMRKVVPWIIEGDWSETWVSKGFGGVKVKCIKPRSNVEGLEVGYERATRPNGNDKAMWDGWEVEQPDS